MSDADAAAEVRYQARQTRRHTAGLVAIVVAAIVFGFGATIWLEAVAQQSWRAMALSTALLSGAWGLIIVALAGVNDGLARWLVNCIPTVDIEPLEREGAEGSP